MTAGATDLQTRVESYTRAVAAGSAYDRADAERAVADLLDALEHDDVRAAMRAESGAWSAVSWVKAGILLAFKLGNLVEMGREKGGAFRFLDKHTFPIRDFTVADGVRIVPGGSIIRRGAHVEPGVIGV